MGPPEDHKAIMNLREFFVLAVGAFLLAALLGGVGLVEVASEHVALLEGMLRRAPVVWARFLEHLVKDPMAPGRASGVPTIRSSN